MYVKGKVLELVLTTKQRPCFWSRRQADAKRSRRLLNMLVHLTPGALAEVMAQPLCFPVCVESALEIRAALQAGCVLPLPRCRSKTFPLRLLPVLVLAPVWMWCLVSLGGNTPCFIVSMHKKLAKCMASSVIRFFFVSQGYSDLWSIFSCGNQKMFPFNDWTVYFPLSNLLENLLLF